MERCRSLFFLRCIRGVYPDYTCDCQGETYECQRRNDFYKSNNNQTHA